MRTICRLCLLACAASGLVGFSLLFIAERDRQSTHPDRPNDNDFVHVLSPEHNAGVVPFDKEFIVNFVLVNPTDRSVPVIGLTGRCGFDGCIGPLDQNPFDIPPHSERAIPCNIKLRRAGPFRVGFDFYVNDRSLKCLEVAVVGTAFNAAEASPFP